VDAHHLDSIAKRFADHRRSRRAALAALAGGGAAALAGLGPVRPSAHATAAQDATPPASPEDEDPAGFGAEFLFVQIAGGGTWAAKPGEHGVFTLTLTSAAASTIYFSDRPERVVGALPTSRFLDNLGFTPAEPPNAALVAQTEEGEDVLVVELFNPVYEEAPGEASGATLTYDARVLADYAAAGLASLVARQDDATLPDRFGPASLFIDDCASKAFFCLDPHGQFIGDIGKHPMCWHASSFDCRTCDVEGVNAICNQTYPAQCQGACTAVHRTDACKARTVNCYSVQRSQGQRQFNLVGSLGSLPFCDTGAEDQDGNEVCAPCVGWEAARQACIQQFPVTCPPDSIQPSERLCQADL
jgi:hypothetical protein